MINPDMPTPCLCFQLFLMHFNRLSCLFTCSGICIIHSNHSIFSDLFVSSTLAKYPGFIYRHINLDHQWLCGHGPFISLCHCHPCIKLQGSMVLDFFVIFMASLLAIAVVFLATLGLLCIMVFLFWIFWTTQHWALSLAGFAKLICCSHALFFQNHLLSCFSGWM